MKNALENIENRADQVDERFRELENGNLKIINAEDERELRV